MVQEPRACKCNIALRLHTVIKKKNNVCQGLAPFFCFIENNLIHFGIKQLISDRRADVIALHSLKHI